ncbi:ParB N-terminal domain-containing protein [Staphylococcus hyicus]|uniref:ParB N-terminal domain-containing protein n=1 Tax=Staphylococcus hyicus TaxID=1284 RepID=UPI0036D2B876
MKIEEMPISKVTWINAQELNENDYNPNVVYNREMNLLKFSLLKQGWIQPILVTQSYEIIDGFHRATLAKQDKQVKDMTNGFVPVVIMDLTEPQRMLLTIRINRAKGSHIAVKMSDIIKTLVRDYGMSLDTIKKEIGATKDEVELLLMDNVFKQKGINEQTKYSKAWIPNK